MAYRSDRRNRRAPRFYGGKGGSDSWGAAPPQPSLGRSASMPDPVEAEEAANTGPHGPSVLKQIFGDHEKADHAVASGAALLGLPSPSRRRSPSVAEATLSPCTAGALQPPGPLPPPPQQRDPWEPHPCDALGLARANEGQGVASYRNQLRSSGERALQRAIDHGLFPKAHMRQQSGGGFPGAPTAPMPTGPPPPGPLPPQPPPLPDAGGASEYFAMATQMCAGVPQMWDGGADAGAPHLCAGAPQVYWAAASAPPMEVPQLPPMPPMPQMPQPPQPMPEPPQQDLMAIAMPQATHFPVDNQQLAAQLMAAADCQYED